MDFQIAEPAFSRAELRAPYRITWLQTSDELGYCCSKNARFRPIDELVVFMTQESNSTPLAMEKSD
jgi:hypothetical protein